MSLPAHWVALIPVYHETVCHKMSCARFATGPPCVNAHAAMAVCISSYMIAGQAQMVLTGVSAAWSEQTDSRVSTP